MKRTVTVPRLARQLRRSMPYLTHTEARETAWGVIRRLAFK